LWTICIHSNTASSAQVEQLRAFLSRHRAQFTSVERVAAEFVAGELNWTERLFEAWALWRAKARVRARRVRRSR
jgi:hypothetical protein